MNKLRSQITKRLDNHVGMFISVSTVILFVIIVLDSIFLPEKADILVEAHGLLFDVILFGVGLSLYERFTKRKNDIQRYKEEIDDYYGWEEKEAMHRIRGNIKRLNKLGVSKINLRQCYLRKADLQGFNLKDSDMRRANLEEAILTEANFRDTILDGANMKYSKLEGADMRFAIVGNTNFKGAYFEGAKAFKSQRKLFVQSGCTHEQLRQITWLSDPLEKERRKRNRLCWEADKGVYWDYNDNGEIIELE